MQLRQFRVLSHQGALLGYASWAYLDQESEQRFEQGDRRLRPQDWKSGDRPWLIDFIAPFGANSESIKAFEANGESSGDFKSIFLNPETGEQELCLVSEWLDRNG